jgi:hypothetical protein
MFAYSTWVLYVFCLLYIFDFEAYAQRTSAPSPPEFLEMFKSPLELDLQWP